MRGLSKILVQIFAYYRAINLFMLLNLFIQYLQTDALRFNSIVYKLMELAIDMMEQKCLN